MPTVKVLDILEGTLMREGAGVKLRRYIGADRTNNFEPILLFDFFDSTDPMDYIAGFPPHPHRGFETVTYLVDGQINHEDNHGHKGAIGPGDVQWMTAGKGIIHSEMPQATSSRLTGLQLWLNLPAAQKWVEPNYQEFAAKDLPQETTESGVLVKVIAGKTDKGTHSPITDITTDPLFLDIQLNAEKSWTQTIEKDHQAIMFVLEGAVQIEKQQIERHELAVLTAGDKVTLQTPTTKARCLLITAKKLHEPIARLGPFVMSTQEEVMQALDDFRNNKF